MSDVAMAASVIGIVATLRHQWPALNGWRIPLVTLLVALLLVFSYEPTDLSIPIGVVVVGILKHAVRIAAEALGAAYMANQIGDRMGVAIAKNAPTNSLPPSRGDDVQ